MSIYRVYPDGTVQDTERERVAFIGCGPFQVVAAGSADEAARIVAEQQAAREAAANIEAWQFVS